MKPIARPLARAGAALAALASIGIWQDAHAVGTAANTAINNTATVSYSVGGVSQTPIESSPAGNSVPGAGNGTATSFVVDRLVDFTVAELSGNATTVTPGQANAVTAFRLANTGNAPQGFALTATNDNGSTVFTNLDTTEVNNLRVFVDANDNDVYDPGVDLAITIDTLAADTDVVVFVVADVPVTVANGQFANVTLTARAAQPGTNGATLEAETTGPEDPDAVDVVFGDDAGDNSEASADQYAVESAALTVAKVSAVVSDPVNGANDPRAIPLAVVEYALTVTNNGAVAATGLQLADPLPANTTFVAGGYAGGTDVSITVGAGAPAYCVAEAGGDSNSDGCAIVAGQLVVGAPALAAVATGAGNQVTIRFRVRID